MIRDPPMPRGPVTSRSTKMTELLVLFLARMLRVAKPPGASVRTSSQPFNRSTALTALLIPSAPLDCTRTVPESTRIACAKELLAFCSQSVVAMRLPVL